MSKRVIIYDYEVFDAIVQILFVFASFAPLFWFDDQFENDILNKVAYYLIIFVTIAIIKTSKRISIHNGFVEKDIHVLFLGSIKKIERFPISEIEDIYITQNDERYFEITAKRKQGSNFIFRTLPNRNPAQEALEVIKAHFKRT